MASGGNYHQELQDPSMEHLLSTDTSHIKDPIQKAVLDNILGKVPTKAPQEKHKCQICNIEVTARAALITHLNGARHAKKMKEEHFDKEPLSPYIEYLHDKKMYYCKLCNTTLNAKIQINAHLQGAKHRNKVASGSKVDGGTVMNNLEFIAAPRPKGKKIDQAQGITTNAMACNVTLVDGNNSSPPPATATQKTESALLFCHTCNIHVNSETQLQQHTGSKKHLNKVNGVVGSRPRVVPYPTKSPKAPLSGSGGATRGIWETKNGNSVRPRYSHNNHLSDTSNNDPLYQRRNNTSLTATVASQSYNRIQHSYQSHPYNLSNNFVSSGIYGGGGNHHQYNSYRHYQHHSDYDHLLEKGDVRGYYDPANVYHVH